MVGGWPEPCDEMVAATAAATAATRRCTFLLALLHALPSSALVATPLLRNHKQPVHARSLSLQIRRAAAPSIVLRGGSSSPSIAQQPPELMPITMGVFSSMLGEGIAMSSLAFHLTRLGAQPLMVGVGIACFSASQMTFSPIMVKLASRIGCSLVLRLCLAGSAVSSLIIALSTNIYGVIAGRACAGVFATCVPVAQVGVTDILPRNQTALGLSRVAAASQLGVVVGPAASALFQAMFAAMGLASEHCLPAVFVLAAAFSLSVLTQMTILDRRHQQAAPAGTAVPELGAGVAATQWSTADEPNQADDAPSAIDVVADEPVSALRLAQPMLRFITIVIGWTAVLSNSIYGLFAPRFLGFQQPQLSATYSAAAALMIATQVVFPKLVAKLGEHRACALGIVLAGTGIGGQSLFRVQPMHSLLYMMNRVGAAVADTATAALVASSSASREDRSRNLALLTSTRAAARIASPILSSKMFALSCKGSVAPGALPFVTAACFAIAIAPLPLWMLRAERAAESKSE